MKALVRHFVFFSQVNIAIALAGGAYADVSVN